MANVREQNIQSAIDAVNSGTPIRAAAKSHAVPYATLHGRLHGATTVNEALLPKQRLSPEEENFLASWARNEEASARAPTKSQLGRMATALLAQGGCAKPVGKRWVDRFLHRHKNVKVKSSRPLDQERRRGSTKEVYDGFFNRLKYQLDSKNIPPRYIANVDEHGMQELETSENCKVIGNSLTSRTYKETSKATPWVSVIEAVTADGRRLTPVVVYTGASLQGQWFSNFHKEDLIISTWKYDYSESGFSNTRIFAKWFKEVHLPETRPETASQWRLLILDEDSSHVNEDFMINAYRNRVQLLYLPPHTSHKSQPLDRSVFSPVKTYSGLPTTQITQMMTWIWIKQTDGLSS